MSQRFLVRPTQDSDADGLQELLADTPQEGSILLNFERQPNYFWATDIGTSSPDLWVMEDTENHRVAGAFSIGKRDVFINGAKTAMRFDSDLRIHRDYQGGRALLRLFKSLTSILGDDIYQTVILEENQASLGTVGSGRLKLQPKYYPAGKHRTNMIELRCREKHTVSHTVRRATKNDIAAMQQFFDTNAGEKQFYPSYDFSLVGSTDSYYRNIKLEDFFLAFSGDELVGMTGLWDQKDFKQTRITGYSKSIQYARPFYNLYAKIVGGLSLPTPGSLTSYIYLHSTVVKNNEKNIFADLLATIRSNLKDSKYDALVVGFDVNDPLHEVTEKYKKVELFSLHFICGYSDDDPMDDIGRNKLMYLETARL